MTLFSNHSQLTANYIQPLLQAAEPRTRMCAANYLRKTGVTTVPVSLFSDPDPLVVRVAMAAAVRMRDRQAFPRLARLVNRAQYADLRESIERQMGPLGN